MPVIKTLIITGDRSESQALHDSQVNGITGQRLMITYLLAGSAPDMLVRVDKELIF